MNKKLIIFDLDGTILNTIDDLADACNYCLSKYVMPLKSVDEVTKLVGNGILKLVESIVVEGTDKSVINKMYNDFILYYSTHSDIKTKAYEGIIELLDKLKAKKIKLVVLSNKADFAVKSLCKKYFGDLFDLCLGEREGIRKKPYPDSLLDIIKKYDLNNNEVLYVGDSEVDYQTAKNANVDLVAVSYGYRTKEQLMSIGATIIIDKPGDLLKYID